MTRPWKTAASVAMLACLLVSCRPAPTPEQDPPPPSATASGLTAGTTLGAGDDVPDGFVAYETQDGTRIAVAVEKPLPEPVQQDLRDRFDVAIPELTDPFDPDQLNTLSGALVTFVVDSQRATGKKLVVVFPEHGRTTYSPTDAVDAYYLVAVEQDEHFPMDAPKMDEAADAARAWITDRADATRWDVVVVD